jgi:hypothetical protein
MIARPRGLFGTRELWDYPLLQRFRRRAAGTEVSP